MSDEALITDVRLIALETLMQKLYAIQLSQLSPEDSKRARETLIETSSQIDVFRGSPPIEVKSQELKMALVAGHVQRFFEIVADREKDIREQMRRRQGNRP